jgi:hypothetical protein
MPSGLQRLVQQQTAQPLPELPEIPMAVVATVTAGAATDGNALVTVTYNGATLPAKYLLHYTPVVGHQVMVAKSGGVITILGRPGGFPPIT